MTRVRIRCLMGHSRWVELAIETEREGMAGATPPQKHPPRECVSCHRMIEAPTANNQRRHALCAAEYTKAQRRVQAHAVRWKRRKPRALKLAD